MTENIDQATAHFELHAAAIRDLEDENARLMAVLRTVRAVVPRADYPRLLRIVDRAIMTTPPPPYAIVTTEDLRAAELCELAARRLRRADLGPVSIAESAVAEAIAAIAVQGERESRMR